MTADVLGRGSAATVVQESVSLLDARGSHRPPLQPLCALRHDRREFVFGFAGIDAVPEPAVAHTVEESKSAARWPSQTKNRSQVSIGRLSMRAPQRNTPRSGNTGTNGTRNGRGRFGSFLRSTMTPEANQSEGEEGPNIREVGQRTDIGQHRDAADEDAGPDGGDVRACESAGGSGQNTAATIRRAPSP